MPDMDLVLRIPETARAYKALGEFVTLIGTMHEPLPNDTPVEGKKVVENITPEIIQDKIPNTADPVLVGEGSVFSQGAPPPPAGTTLEEFEADPPNAIPPPSDVELDSMGRPWDARINNKVRSKKANKEWKLIRGIDKALVASVHAELDVASPGAGTHSADPPPDDTAKPMTSQELKNFIANGANDESLDFIEVTAMLQKHGIGNMMLISEFPDKIETIYEELCNMRK